MNKKRGTVALTALAALFSVAIQQADACTRATYIREFGIRKYL